MDINLKEALDNLRDKMLSFYSVHKSEFDDDLLRQITMSGQPASFRNTVNYQLYEAAGEVLDILEDRK